MHIYRTFYVKNSQLYYSKLRYATVLNFLKDNIWFESKMAPLNELRQFTVIVCFICTDIYLKFFHNFDFDLSVHNLKI